METKDWNEMYHMTGSLQVYFANVMHKAEILQNMGLDHSDLQLTTAAKQIRIGVAGVLDFLEHWQQVSLNHSSIVKVPIQNLDKPDLTLVKGGGGDAGQNIDCTRGESTTRTLPFGKDDGT